MKDWMNENGDAVDKQAGTFIQAMKGEWLVAK